jgi:hypothetical protein
MDADWRRCDETSFGATTGVSGKDDDFFDTRAKLFYLLGWVCEFGRVRSVVWICN